jgi:RNA polymerase sigma factor (TIGR02999 family)
MTVPSDPCGYAAAPGLTPDEPLHVARPTGPGESLDRLTDRCYAELLAVAGRMRRRLDDAATLDTGALLHETFLRLAEQRQARWEDRPHFLAAAAGMMRRVLVDHVRRRRAAKRGGALRPVTLDEQLGVVDTRDDALIALDDALARLGTCAPRLARVVEYRYFAGMTEVEIAAALGLTERTVRRDWIKARGWLQAALGGAV